MKQEKKYFKHLGRVLLLAMLSLILIVGLCGFSALNANAEESLEDVIASGSEIAYTPQIVSRYEQIEFELEPLAPTTFTYVDLENNQFNAAPLDNEGSFSYAAGLTTADIEIRIDDVAYSISAADSLVYSHRTTMTGGTRYHKYYLGPYGNQLTTYRIYIPFEGFGTETMLPVAYVQSDASFDNLTVWNKSAIGYSLPTTPTRNGYTFAGWYYDEELTEPYSEGDVLLGNTSFYAKWTVNQYTVTYVFDGGMTPIRVNYGAEISSDAPAVLPEGKTFAGWYSDEELTEAFDFDGFTVSEDISLYAKYDVILITLTFYVEGEVYCSYQVPYGTILVENGEATAEAAEILETIDVAALVAAYGENISVLGNAEFNAVVHSSIVGWNKLGMWFANNWLWLVIGVAVVAVVSFLVVYVWKRA